MSEYRSAVMRIYYEKKKNDQLSFNLISPRPANIKKECLIVIEDRFLPKDEQVIRLFVGQKDDTNAYRNSLKNVDASVFKPISNFLRTNEIDTHEKNIELLAWLIDFEPRPYAVWLKNKDNQIGKNGSGTEIDDIKKIEEETLNPVDPESEQDKPTSQKKPSKLPMVSAVFILLLVLGFICYRTIGIDSGDDRCMYWTGDHYERIACDERPADTTAMVIALDSNKLVHFKRITRADTLTAASIGKVWYIKINDGVEYYTSPGEPPAYPGRRLLPLTARILDVHPRNPG